MNKTNFYHATRYWILAGDNIANLICEAIFYRPSVWTLTLDNGWLYWMVECATDWIQKLCILQKFSPLVFALLFSLSSRHFASLYVKLLKKIKLFFRWSEKFSISDALMQIKKCSFPYKNTSLWHPNSSSQVVAI